MEISGDHHYIKHWRLESKREAEKSAYEESHRKHTQTHIHSKTFHLSILTDRLIPLLLSFPKKCLLLIDL